MMTPATLIADRKAIVFDLDGTLLDTVADIRQAMSDALVERGCAALPPDYMPPNLHGAFPGALMAMMAQQGTPEAEHEAVIAAYTRRYAERAHRSSRPYPGLPAFLADCRRRGVGLGVCTNKRHAPAVQALQQCGILHYFDHVSGCDTVARPKPDPLPLLEACAALGATPRQAAYVGDTHVDAASAAAADMPFLLFRSGYGSPLVHDYPIAAVFDDYAELWQADALPM